MKTITKKEDFYCNPKYNIGRTGNYEKAKKVCSKWEYAEVENWNMNGNLAYELTFDAKTMKVINRPPYNSNPEHNTTIDFYKAISSPLAMYRLICLFERMPTDKYNDWYKVVWNFPLKHKDSGQQLHFGEWKGAFGFHSEYMNITKVPKSYLKDLKELLEFLVTDEVPHPYDNLVAGSVA